MITLAIDVMSGDFGLRSAIPAVKKSLEKFPDLHVLLVGDVAAISAVLPADIARERITLVASASVITADDRPSRVLKTRPDSSMQIAIDAVADARAQGALSAGNTGALMALGVLRLGVMAEIKRPAICAPMPTRSGVSWILDLGANVDCDAQQLHQFAQMGNALVNVLFADSSYSSSSFWRKPESQSTIEKDSGLRQNDAPRIALLNIGSEAGKGNALVQEAAQLINDDVALNFVGFVEGNTLYDGAADVIVCDGFAGNVLLKTAEGVAGFIRERLKQLATRSMFTCFLATLAWPLLKRFSAEINADQYNGACLLGLKGVVVKSHGNASADAFAQAIACAYTAAKQNLPVRLTEVLAQN